jgi:hypothetical protein
MYEFDVIKHNDNFYNEKCATANSLITIKKRNLKAEGGNKSLYATRLAINLYWAYWLMETRSLRHSSNKCQRVRKD